MKVLRATRPLLPELRQQDSNNSTVAHPSESAAAQLFLLVHHESCFTALTK
jgi:hypothetical protein